MLQWLMCWQHTYFSLLVVINMAEGEVSFYCRMEANRQSCPLTYEFPKVTTFAVHSQPEYSLPWLQCPEDKGSLICNLKLGSHCQVRAVNNNEIREHLFETIFSRH